MRRLKDAFRKLEVQLCIFLLGLVLFNWPLLSIAHDKGPCALFLYLFVGWMFIILMIFCIAVSVDAAPPPKADDDGEDRV